MTRKGGGEEKGGGRRKGEGEGEEGKIKVGGRRKGRSEGRGEGKEEGKGRGRGEKGITSYTMSCNLHVMCAYVVRVKA